MNKTAVEFIVHDSAGGVQAAETAGADLARLGRFRQQLYGCFGRWADTLFELTDALARVGRPVRSVAELMFEPVSRRGWGSLYQALEHGVIDREAARALLVGGVQAPGAGQVPMFAVDQSKYPRPYTRHVPDVGMQYAAEQDGYGGVPVVAGWSMQWVAHVGQLASAGTVAGDQCPRSSWSQPVHVRRVGTGDNANEIAAAQIAAVAAVWGVSHPGTVPLMLLDIGYCPIYLTQHLPADTRSWCGYVVTGCSVALETTSASFCMPASDRTYVRNATPYLGLATGRPSSAALPTAKNRGRSSLPSTFSAVMVPTVPHFRPARKGTNCRPRARSPSTQSRHALVAIRSKAGAHRRPALKVWPPLQAGSSVSWSRSSGTTNEPVMRKQCTCGKPRWALRAQR